VQIFIHYSQGFVYSHTAAGFPDTGLYAHYDISTELGKGSFATVMKAVSRATGQWYAVKMIHKERIARTVENANQNNASRSAQLSREINILEKLKHPNICQLKEVFYQDGDISTFFSLVCKFLLSTCTAICEQI
jgi:serine/threonine/tyrosine protein kinase RAD53